MKETCLLHLELKVITFRVVVFITFRVVPLLHLGLIFITFRVVITFRVDFYYI